MACAQFEVADCTSSVCSRSSASEVGDVSWMCSRCEVVDIVNVELGSPKASGDGQLSQSDVDESELHEDARSSMKTLVLRFARRGNGPIMGSWEYRITGDGILSAAGDLTTLENCSSKLEGGIGCLTRVEYKLDPEKVCAGLQAVKRIYIH